jgi:DNA-binding NtrC family response regulator
MIVQTLRAQGYEVFEAPNGEEALRFAYATPQIIHALVTDVIMPEIGGPELAEQLCAVRPDLKVLFTSGYTEGINSSGKKLPKDAAFLQKPYMPEKLVIKVREVLDG